MNSSFCSLFLLPTCLLSPPLTPALSLPQGQLSTLLLETLTSSWPH